MTSSNETKCFEIDWKAIEDLVRQGPYEEWKSVEGGRILVPSDGCPDLYALEEAVRTESQEAPDVSDDDLDEWLYEWRHERPWENRWQYRNLVAGEIDMAGSYHPVGCFSLPEPEGRLYLLDAYSDPYDLDHGERVVGVIEPESCQRALCEFIRELLASEGTTFDVDFGSFFYTDFNIFQKDLMRMAREGLCSAAQRLSEEDLESLIPVEGRMEGKPLADAFAEAHLFGCYSES
jgi:hypothetical protein